MRKYKLKISTLKLKKQRSVCNLMNRHNYQPTDSDDRIHKCIIHKFSNALIFQVLISKILSILLYIKSKFSTDDFS